MWLYWEEATTNTITILHYHYTITHQSIFLLFFAPFALFALLSFFLVFFSSLLCVCVYIYVQIDK